MSLSIPLFIPLASGLLAMLLPRGAAWLARQLVLGGTFATLFYVVAMLVDFDSSAKGLQWVTRENWIETLGIHYSLGVDGLNLFLIAVTALLFTVCALWSALREWDRPRLYYFNLGLAETAVLGAFMAQDLALFVVFFDLMLVPFYFLIGVWGRGERVQATTKFVIYTLVGSLLMLAGAIALGVLSTPDGGQISFELADLQRRTLGHGTQVWIFLLFAAAFLVKAPAFPFHGWMPDTYRATPTPVLVLLSGILSKVGAYGFLRIVLPILPGASSTLQELMLVIAVVSILYGSVMAFSQDDARLVVGYSSIAQLGFITLGIFALDPKGAQGAVIQMVNHALVVAGLFFVIAVIAGRSRESESLERLGGLALRAPVLAALFLIVALATLAMPGSPNFVGEILILFGAFDEKIVYGLVASAGVALAAVYAIRLYQRTMHNRVGPDVEPGDLSWRLDMPAIAPVVLVLLALALYPQFVLHRTEATTTTKIAAAAAKSHQTPGPDRTASSAGAPDQSQK
ncbi:MAG: NADH-quinone oxidoreductase subunit M [Thermoleophilaceae bacterium]|nr:NADH-quinone oxidoreductase subunit M [Thermoleophilaceae bacterium]